MPHGGAKLTSSGEIPYEERRIEVLYVGSRKRKVQEHEIQSLPNDDRELFEVAKYMLKKYPYLTPEGVYELYIKEVGIEVTQDIALDYLETLYRGAVCDVRRYYQGKTIETLASAGIHIDIYGAGWTKIEEKYPDYVHLHEIIDPEECIKLMRESKITLNIMPWFKYGAHERIYNAMLNGSVCVSDTSDYLKKHFKNGCNIVLYELNKWDGLVRNIQLLLENPIFAKQIISNQKENVAKSTWRDRLHNILEQRFEEGKDFI